MAMLAISIAGFALATIWLHTGRAWRFRLLGTALLALIPALVMLGANSVRASWDASENRRNSFSRADEASLSRIQQQLKITVVLSPEDPRLTDYEHNVLRKLRRILPRPRLITPPLVARVSLKSLRITTGEIWYEMNGQKVMERSTIEAVVLEQIYK